MDSIQTIIGVETPAEETADVADIQDAEALAQDEGDAAEMGELAVEDWDYQRPRRGEVRDGVILAIREQEIIVDVGAKRDGIVPYADMQRMGPEALAALSVGDQIPVYILRPEDQDGNLLVSLFLARQAQAWVRAQELAEDGEVWEEQVISYNKGGVVVPVGEIRGFVPASQIPGFPLGLSQEERLSRLSTLVGETLQVKVIEINRRKRRLILSSTVAQKQWRDEQRERLLADLREGEVRKGVVSSVCSFGAFVDLGGADGLVHLSELSWRRVRHPKEVVRVGEEVEVYVLRLDHDRKRIGLSLKRLQPEPWALVEDKYELGQLVEGVVTNVVDFGAFAEIEEGVEGLVHVSELTDAPISHPREVVKKGDLLLLRIIRIDIRRKRLGLSLKRVLESEWAEWAARLAQAEAQRQAEAAEAEPSVEEGVEEPVEVPEAEAEELEPAVQAEEPKAEVPEAEAEELEPAVQAEEPTAEVPEAEAEEFEPAVQAEEPTAEVPEAEAEELEPAEQAEEPTAEVPEAEAEELEPAVQAEEPTAEVPEAEAEELEPAVQAEEPTAEVPEAEAEELEPAVQAEEPTAEVPEAKAEELEPAEQAEEPTAEIPEAEAEEFEPTEQATEPTAEMPEAAAEEPESPEAGPAPVGTSGEEPEEGGDEPDLTDAGEQASKEAIAGKLEGSSVQDPELATVEA